MLPPSKDYRVNLKLQFGRISRPTGLELNVADGMVAIVSLNHVFSEHEYPEVASDFVVVGNQEWIVTPGNIKNNYQDLPHLSEPLNKKMSSFYSGLISVSEQSSQILVGEEVENFFTNTSKAKKSYSKAKGLLSV